MYVPHELMIEAEVTYRREQLTALRRPRRPRRASRSRRGARPRVARSVTATGESVGVA